jgi:thiamine transport system ATP-binding protein
MLDEPLGALDRGLRTRLLDELAELFARLGLPIIYVTHDQEEALAIGDRVAVINAGRLEAVMPARELWLSPPNEFVARFLGLNNIVPFAPERGIVATPWGSLPLTGAPAAPSGSACLLLRPDALAVDPDGPLSGIVTAVTFRGETTKILARPKNEPDGPLLEAHLRSDAGDPPVAGQGVRLSISRSGVLFLP